MPGLEVSHLRKSYGDTVVVDDVSFDVAAGEIYGLIGPNGAGKSTTMMMILGLLKADEGAVSLEGRPFDRRNPDMRAQFGVVPQQLAIYPKLTALQNLRFFGVINGLSGRHLQERIDHILELTGLTASANQLPGRFSGGMSRRLNFGIALLHEPKFVILDEPTVGIDPQSRSALLDGVRALSQQGMGVVYASHYMEEVEAVCDRIGIIDHGKLLKEGKVDELLERADGELLVEVKSLPEELRSAVSEHAAIQEVGDGGVTLLVRPATSPNSGKSYEHFCALMAILKEAAVPLTNVESQENSLEALFLKLTGRKLRD